MPTIPIHPPSPNSENNEESPLPQLLQTPSGLAIVEIQGTINLPTPLPGTSTTPIGRLVFPKYDPNDPTGSTAWQKTVHLYVGKHQRLTGEVKKLPKAIAVLRKRETPEQEGKEELEIAEIVYHKLLFSNRPEPVDE